MRTQNDDIVANGGEQQPHHASKRPRHDAKRLVLGISCALCIVGVTALGMALTWPDPNGAVDEHTIALGGNDLSTENVRIPGEVRMLVDTWGEEPPEEAVSPTYAVALASDVAERCFGMKPAGRARVALITSEQNFDPDHYDMSGECAWSVTMETEEGEVQVVVDALNGSDSFASADRDFSYRYEGSWLEEFDEWERTGVSPSDKWFGSEDAALAEAAKALIPDPPSIHELTNEERAERIEGKMIKRDLAAQTIAEHRDDPRAEAAIAIVNETDLGSGSQAVSAEWVGDGAMLNSTATIDVALDDGRHILCYLRGFGPYELMGYERHADSYLDTMYGNEIAELQAAME